MGNEPLAIPADYAASRGLTRQAEATELVVAAIAPDDGTEVRLTPTAAAAWKRMTEAAESDGVILWPLSGFRSIARQTELIRNKLAEGQVISEILTQVAAPGYSEHHTGKALDIGSPGQPTLDERFERTAAYRWLTTEAPRFGWRLSYPRGNPRGFIYEPWHWCFHDDGRSPHSGAP